MGAAALRPDIASRRAHPPVWGAAALRLDIASRRAYPLSPNARRAPLSPR